MNPSVEPIFVKKPEAAKALGVSPRTLDNWVARRIIPYVAIVRDTPGDLLDDLDLQRLLAREDVLPPVPGEMEQEEY